MPRTSVGPVFYLSSLQAAVLLIWKHKNTTVNFLRSNHQLSLVLPSSSHGFTFKPKGKRLRSEAIFPTKSPFLLHDLCGMFNSREHRKKRKTCVFSFSPFLLLSRKIKQNKPPSLGGVVQRDFARNDVTQQGTHGT